MADTQAVLEAENVVVRFPVRTADPSNPGIRRHVMTALNGVSLHIDKGETVGLVGESGSGKSTLGQAMLRLVNVESGRIAFMGRDLVPLSGRRLREARRGMHLIYQDPYSSLDPLRTTFDIIREPLMVKRMPRSEQTTAVREAMDLVRLPASFLERRPWEFSGGQRQRIAIARAIVTRPAFVVCDEPLSALDVSTQAQVANLLMDLQDDLSLSYMFIGHDLGVVKAMSHRVAVMYLGEIVEEGPSERVYQQPAHPYTVALLAANPDPRKASANDKLGKSLDVELPSPINPPTGCRFHTRCPVAMDICATSVPEVSAVAGGGTARCHLLTKTGESTKSGKHSTADAKSGK